MLKKQDKNADSQERPPASTRALLHGIKLKADPQEVITEPAITLRRQLKRNNDTLTRQVGSVKQILYFYYISTFHG